MSRVTEPIGLPGYHLIELSIINGRINSDSDFEIPIIDFVPTIQTDLALIYCNDERDGA